MLAWLVTLLCAAFAVVLGMVRATALVWPAVTVAGDASDTDDRTSRSFVRRCRSPRAP